MKHVVSVSLGSSKRDHRAEVELAGERFILERIGTDGDFAKAIALIRELDGKADAIGLGGIDIYLFAGPHRKCRVRDSKKLTAAATRTPVADGSGLKNTLEREAIRYLAGETGLELRGKKVLMVSAVDRYGMAGALAQSGCEMIFGDLVFGLGIPIAIRSFPTFDRVARTLLPIVTKMPHRVLYPLGKEQDKEPGGKHQKYYREADVIAGDYLFIRKYLPGSMKGKWIITNTVTSSDVEVLRDRGVDLLVTTTPDIQGRSFGTNVMEAAIVALLGRPWEDIGDEDYLAAIENLGLRPRIEWLDGRADCIEGPNGPV